MNQAFRAGMILVFGLAVLIGVVAGRSQAAPVAPAALPPAPTLVPAPPPGQVNIDTNAAGNPPGLFNPPVLQAKVGNTITFINNDTVAHTATAENGAFNTDVLNPGQSKTWKAVKPGRYLYSCFLHPEMHGEIDISP